MVLETVTEMDKVIMEMDMEMVMEMDMDIEAHMDMENLILQEFRIRIIAIIINPKNGIILRSKRINLR